MAKTKPIAPMPVSERAKIFAPFAALKGLPEALKEKEKIRVPKKELSEYMANKINCALGSLKTGQIITVIYYNSSEQEYLQLTGMVARIDATHRFLQIVAVKIPFDDLYEIIIA